MKAIGLLLCVVVSGCAEVNRLREAQEAFSRAADAENRERLADAPSAGFGEAADVASARAGYGAALLELEALEADSRAKASLEADHLWGTALALKALCEWRLGLHDRALISAAGAAASGDSLGPRDRAMMAALPGLVMTDQLFAKLDRKRRGQPAGEWEAAKSLGGRAMEVLESARKDTDAEHPLRSYLYQAQLAAWRNLRQAHGAWNNGLDFKTDDPLRLQAKACFDEFSRANPRAAVVEFWRVRCGF
jgi:hypothetical protein